MRTKEGAFYLYEESRKLKVPLTAENILGRESGLMTETMSRRHCQIVTKNDRWFIADLDSTNGVLLNGKKIRPSEWYSVKTGDEIILGKMNFVLRGPVPGEEAKFERATDETAPGLLAEAGEPAGFIARLIGSFIDGIVAFFVAVIIILLTNIRSEWILVIAPLIIPLILSGQTLGKKAIGIRVVTKDGLPLSYAQISIREGLGKLLVLSWAPTWIATNLIKMGHLTAGLIIGLIPLGILLHGLITHEFVWDMMAGTKVIEPEGASYDDGDAAEQE